MQSYSITYSIPYVIIFLILLYLSYLEQRYNGNKTRKALRLITFFLLLCFFGLRGYVASDWYSYTFYFDYIKPITTISLKELLTTFYEPGFNLFTSIIKAISDNYFFYVFINSLIDLLLLNIVLKKYCSNYYVFAACIFFVFCGEFEINLLRNMKSILLFLLSIKYIENRKIWPFLLIMLCSLTFHLSAIFYIPFYFFGHRNNKKIFYVIISIGVIIYFFQIQYITPIAKFIGSLLGGDYFLKAEGYILTDKSGVTFGSLYVFIPLILVIFNYDRLYKENDYNVIFLNMFFMYCISTLYFSEVLVFRQRFTALFVFSLCVLLSQLWLYYKKSYSRTALLQLMFILLLSKALLTNTPIVNKYDNLLFGIENYESRVYTFTRFIKFD